MAALVGAALLLGLATLGPAEAPWCGPTKLTAYVRTDYGPYTFDGTPIGTAEKIAAASWDVRLGALADIPDYGTVRIADRGMLGSGSPMPWVDVAVWSRSEAFALTSVRHVCFRRPRLG
jgi:hypothetical protein